jgi:hypothetical protein
MNIPIHTGPRARLLRAAIDWRNRAIKARETLTEYRMQLSPRSTVTLRQQSIVLRSDRMVVDLFAAAGGAL